MKICLISDTHINITTPGQIRAMVKLIAKEDFDLLIHAGDYCGALVGHKSVKPTIDIIRKYLPDKPFVTTIGNHDFWVKGSTAAKHEDNYNKIKEIFKKNNVHFIDEDGIYIHPDFPLIKIMGCSGWYQNGEPGTNDIKYLPVNTPYIHAELRKRAHTIIQDQMDELDKNYDPSIDTVVFLSHFAVIEGNDHKGSFAAFSWSVALGEIIQETYNTKFFLNGHSHMNYSGPLRWESGSDYYLPKYKIIQI